MALIQGWEAGGKIAGVLGLNNVTDIDLRIRVDSIPTLTAKMHCPDVVVEQVAKLVEEKGVVVQKIYVSSVGSCARCGSDHTSVEFTLLERPCEDWTHWGTCPNNGEPIMLKMVETSEESEL